MNRIIKYIVVHCTATPEGRDHRAKDIDLWHKQRGWAEIGYNYVVRLNGEVEKGRDIVKIPSHVKGYNKESIGVVYVGGIDKNTLRPKDTRTNEQKVSLLKLLKKLKQQFPKAQIKGHRDFPNVNKACPCFDAQKEYSNL